MFKDMPCCNTHSFSRRYGDRGGAIGAGAGAVVGAAAGNTGLGAVVGAGAGVAGGYLYDQHQKSKEEKREESGGTI